ncbi:signal transducing kinase of the PAK, partial [Rhizopus stolonifer]
MQQVNGIPVLSSDPGLLYSGLDEEPTWFSAQGGVYKCIERSTNKAVAIKKYLVEENQYEDAFVMPKELVENEIYSMTKCVHPNILKLYAVHLHQEFVYLVMPLCTGGSLQHYVFDHHLTVGQLVYIITSITSGLAKVHSHGYIHRDIKCDNIFLDQETNSIVIGDFGVVSISPAADSSVEEAGVVLFWSPELVQQKIVNHKVDIWALGIVILEVLNGGKAPYEDEKLDEEQIKERILSIGKPEYPPNLPPGLVDLLDCCLDPDPRTRSSASSILQHPFLKEYEPELLFPATRMDQKKSVSHPTTDEKPTCPPAKCRLPVPSFSVDRSVSAAIPVKEKIANVIRKRQSMTDANRHQGSRIPMLCIQPVMEEPELKITESRIKPGRSSALAPVQQKSLSGGSLLKPQLTRSNTVPSRIDQVLKSPSTRPLRSPTGQLKSPTHQFRSSLSTADIQQKRATQRSPLAEPKTRTQRSHLDPPTVKPKRELPPKCSVYRKRLPAGESRTARLMMGVSTNGRRQSFRQREEGETEVTPTLGHRFGKLFHKPKESTLRRPMSSCSTKPA